jgi:cytochrome d ubiquinol oxidase subunit I
VFGVLQTSQSESPGVAAATVIISLTVFTLLYAGLAAIAGWLMIHHIRAGAPDAPTAASDAGEPLPAFSY